MIKNSSAWLHEGSKLKKPTSSKTLLLADCLVQITPSEDDLHILMLSIADIWTEDNSRNGRELAI